MLLQLLLFVGQGTCQAGNGDICVSLVPAPNLIFVLRVADLGTQLRQCASLEDFAGLAQILYPETEAYREREAGYFYANFQLGPRCILQPRGTVDVSLAVQALVATPSCSFAIRGSGQGTGNNIADGVTIDLGRMNKVAYHPENDTVSAQPGAQWRDVYAVADANNVAVAGGRVGVVGTAGFLLGGGLSIFMARQGMACDNVRRFEVVLASGEVVTADRDKRPDLFAALKGGTNNLGIVTRFDLNALPTGPLWAGNVLYPSEPSVSSALGDAIVSFAKGIDEGTINDASTVLIQLYEVQLRKTFWFAQLANLDGKEMGSSHQDFWAIQPNMSSTTRFTNLTALTGDAEVLETGLQVIWFTHSFKNDARVVAKAVELQEKLIEWARAHVGDEFESMNVFQALPAKLGRLGAERGGNVLGLDRLGETHLLWLGSLHIKDRRFAGAAQDMMQRFADELEAYATSLGLAGEWKYPNYANHLAQDPLAGYGHENLVKLAAAAKKYDPDGVFQFRVPGGFKISKTFPGYGELVGEPRHDEL